MYILTEFISKSSVSQQLLIWHFHRHCSQALYHVPQWHSIKQE